MASHPHGRQDRADAVGDSRHVDGDLPVEGGFLLIDKPGGRNDPGAGHQHIDVAEPGRAVIHPLWLRAVHWINALAMILMIMSGWQIYNASPLFSFLTFSHSITLGGWLGGALQWHFAAMWLLAVASLITCAQRLHTVRTSPGAVQPLPGAAGSDGGEAATS